MEAARRNTRPTLRRRFDRIASTVQADGGHAVELDGKPVHTPARRLLAAPSRSLAEAIAAEWEAQHEAINPATMPLTPARQRHYRRRRRSAAAGRGRGRQVSGVRPSVLPRGQSGRTGGMPAPLLESRSSIGRRTRSARNFASVEGITFISPAGGRLRAAEAAIPRDPWQLGAVHAVTTLTGSALIALALAHLVLLDRGSMAGRQCRRGLEHGAMGSRRACAGATDLPVCRIGGGRDGT